MYNEGSALSNETLYEMYIVICIASFPYFLVVEYRRH